MPGVKQLSNLTPTVYPAAASLGILILGFGVMNAFWFLSSWPNDVLGLYDFKSATVGDGLVLPLLMFVLARIGQWHLRLGGRQRGLVVAAATLGMVGGVLTQVQWLSDPAVRLNWTIPAPGVFNAPGWYHAAFLILASGAFAAAGVRALLASRQRLADRVTPPPWEYGAALVLVPLFPALLRADFLTSLDAISTVLAAGAPAGGLSFLVLLVVARRHVSRGIIPALAGAATSVTLPLLLVFGPSLEWPEAIAISTISAFAANFVLPLWSTRRWGQVVATLLMLVMASAAIGLSAHQLDIPPAAAVWLHALCTAVIGSGVTLATFKLLQLNISRRSAAESLINVGALLLVVAFGAWLGFIVESPAFEGLFVIWSISIVSAIAFERYLFRELVNAEDANSKLGKRIHAVRVYQWGILSLCIVLLDFLVAEVTLAEASGAQAPTWPTRALVTSGTLAILGLVVAFILSHLPQLPLWARRLLVATTAAATLAFGITGVLDFFRSVSSSDRFLIVAFTLAVPLTGLATFVGLSLYSNVFRLRGRELNLARWCGLIACGLLAASVVGVAVLLIIAGTKGHFAFGLLVLTAGALTPRYATVAVLRDDLSSWWVKTSPKGGLLQDAALASVLCVLVTAYPTFNLLLYPDLSSAIVRTVALLGVIAGLYAWVISNNVEHAHKYDPLRPGGPWRHPDEANMPFSAGERFRRIRAHIRRQNVISALMLLPVVPYLITSLDVEEVGSALLGAGPASPDAPTHTGMPR